jgi:pimeloyl-[acyl-carrier protein] methyl ester esterase
MNASRLHVEKTGAGPPLTLIHGWGLNGAVWDSLAARLANSYELHIVDLPGHGQSTHVHADTLEAVADCVAQASDCTNLAGWSLGGQVAMSIALRHPAVVRKLVLIGSTPKFVASEDWANGKPLAVLDQFAQELATNYAPTIRRFLALQTLQAPHARAIIAALQRAVTARGAPDTMALMAGLDLLRSNDLRAVASTIAAPTLILQGARDALTAAHAAAWLADAIPHATLRLFDDAAHAPFLSHEDACVAEINAFLRGRGLRESAPDTPSTQISLPS